MPAGSVPDSTMNVSSVQRSSSHPTAWKLYRFGLVTGGLAWICIASTLCGCSGPNSWLKNQTGRHYYHKGQYAAARNEFERALMDNPYNATYAYNVGKAMEKSGDSSGAEQMYQHALTLNPSHQPAYHSMSEMLVAEGRPEEAQQLLTAWSQTQPYSAASRVEMAQFQRKTGNIAAAEQEVNTALQMRPRYRQALNERSRIYQVTGRPTRNGPFSALALSSRTPQQAMQPQPGMVMATPQNSAALNMASSMPQRDPTMVGGVIQASYSQPQMATRSMGTDPMLSNAPPMQHQANMMSAPPTAGQNWSPAPAAMQHPGAMMGQTAPNLMPVPAAHMQAGMNVPQPLPMQHPQPVSQQQMMQQRLVPQPTMAPYGMPANMPTATGMPVNQPIELGQPVPLTQVSPAMTDAPIYPQAQVSPMLSGTPTVQAF